MGEGLTANDLKQIRANGTSFIADEIERLQACEKRLFAIAEWIERNHPDDFKMGLWDAINRA